MPPGTAQTDRHGCEGGEDDGEPAGRNGLVTSATKTASTAVAAASPLRRRGQSRAAKAAAAAASRPHWRGSPRALPTRAPTRVMRFQPTKTAIPVSQKPRRAAARSGWASPTAVDSSIVSCAAASRRMPWTPRNREVCRA